MANIAVFLEQEGALLSPKSVAAIRVGRMLASSWGATLYGLAVVNDSSHVAPLLQKGGSEGIDKIIAVMAPMVRTEELSSHSLAGALIPLLTERPFSLLLIGASMGGYELATTLAMVRDSYLLPNVELDLSSEPVTLVHRLPMSTSVIRWSPYSMERFVVALVHGSPISASLGSEEEVEAIAIRSRASSPFPWLMLPHRAAGNDATFLVVTGRSLEEEWWQRLVDWSTKTAVPVFTTHPGRTDPWGALQKTHVPLSAVGAALVGMSASEVEAVLPGLNFIRRALLVGSELPEGISFPETEVWGGGIHEFIDHIVSEYAI